VLQGLEVTHAEIRHRLVHIAACRADNANAHFYRDG
jgi:hypothetical protein